MRDDEVAKAEDIVREALLRLGAAEVPVSDFGRSPGMDAMDAITKMNEALGSVTYVNWATPPSKTAKNKRRARARQRARELRRSAGGTPLAATALPALAPATAGEPGPEEGAWNRIYLVPADWRHPVRMMSDEAAGLVPLPEKPKPVERPFVPRKIGEF